MQDQIAKAGLLPALAAKLAHAVQLAAAKPDADADATTPAPNATALAQAAATLAAPPCPVSDVACLTSLFATCHVYAVAFKSALTSAGSADAAARPQALQTGASPAKKGAASAKGAPVDAPAPLGPPVATLEAALRLQASLLLARRSCCSNVLEGTLDAYTALLQHPDAAVLLRTVQLLHAFAGVDAAVKALLQVRSLSSASLGSWVARSLTPCFRIVPLEVLRVQLHITASLAYWCA